MWPGYPSITFRFFSTVPFRGRALKGGAMRS